MSEMREIFSTASDIFPAVMILFSLFGGAWLLLLFSLIFKRIRDKKWSREDMRESVADLLVYDRLIKDGVMLNKNGSLTAAWIYRGADAQSLTNGDRNVLAARLNAALKQLGSGWMLHCDTVRSQCPKYSNRIHSHFPDAVSQAIDDERRDYFERSGQMYQSVNVLAATYFPPYLSRQKFADIMLTDHAAGADTKKENRGEMLVRNFERELANIESGLESADGFKLTRLRSEAVETEDGATVRFDNLLSWLQQCFTGETYPMRLPSAPAELNSLIGGEEMFVGITPKIGDKFVQCVSIGNFPVEAHANILNALSLMNIDYRWSTRFIFLDPHDAMTLMEKIRKKWKQKIRGFIDALLNNTNGRINQDAAEMTADCEAAITEQSAGVITSGYYTSTIILRDENLPRLDENAAYVKKVCGELGFPARIETVNNVEAFLGSLPAHGIENLRAPLMNTLNLAHLLPTSSIWLGEDKCPCDFYPENSPALLSGVASGSSPFRLNLHVRDLGHTVIFGPTDAGKSVLLATLAAQFLRYQGMTIFHFDKGKSAYTLCRAVGGQHYDIGSSTTILDGGGKVDKANYAFCPLQYLDDASDVEWATGYISTLCELGGMKVLARHRNVIAEALKSWQRTAEKFVSMEDFHTLISAADHELAEFLQPYTHAGQYGFMLAARADELNLNGGGGGYCVFEIDDLMAMGDERIILPVLLYLFRRIEKNLKGQPAVIILDEAWLMLGHKVFREQIREWFKVLRKKNCAVILATQSLSDAANSGILDVIIESTATKIFLPNPRARNEQAANLYRQFGLNGQQIRILSEALPKRQYYYTSALGNRLFELALGELQLALLAVSDRESVATVEKLIALHGEDKWLAPWLIARRVSPEKISALRSATDIVKAKELV